MKRIFYLLFIAILFFQKAAHAQCGALVSSVTTTESRCAATGSIVISASGGAAPQEYQYRISAGPTTTAFTSTNIIGGLPPGTYSVIVRDVTANCTNTIENVIVAGTYITPSVFYNSTAITCMNGADGTISVASQTGGRPAYSFQIVAPSPSQVGTISSTGTFTGLIPGTYKIEMTDSCGGVQTRNQTVGNYTWSIRSSTNVTKPSCQNIRVNVFLTNSNGTNSPNAIYTGFQYGISRFAGDTTWFSSTPFDFNIGLYRSATILIKDNCGNILTRPWTDAAPIVNATVATSNLLCSTFTATVTGQTNMSATSTTYCLYDATNTNPIGVCQASPIFNNLAYNDYTIRIIEACYDTTMLRTVNPIKPKPTVASGVDFSNTCVGFTAKVGGQININNPQYCLYLNGNPTTLGCNTTGIFSNLMYGTDYCITIQNDPLCYDTLITRCFTATRPIQSLGNNVTITNITCSTFVVSVNGQLNLNNPVYCLYNNLDVLLSCNSTGVFNNLSIGSYCIKMQNDVACFDTLITRCFVLTAPTPSVGAAVITSNQTCTSFRAVITGLTNLSSPVYRLFDASNSTQIGTDQSSPVFNLIPYGSYCIRVINDPLCYDTTITRCFSVTIPLLSISSHSHPLCNVFGTSIAEVEFLSGMAPFAIKIYSPTGVLLSTAVSSATYHEFFNMPSLPASAKYKMVVTDACGRVDSTSTSTEQYYMDRTITKTAKCPSGTYPNGTGDVKLTITENIGSNFRCKIIKKNGVVLTINPTSTANSHHINNFLGLEPATYIFETNSSGCNVNVYDTVIIPIYAYPNLTASKNFQCDNGSQSIVASVTNGAPPYLYQIFGSEPISPSISTAYQSSNIFNFNTGTTYSLVRLRVLDACANASINDVGFQPIVTPIIQRDRNCFLDSVILTTDTIPGATYNWYKRTYSPIDSILVGTGKKFVIPFLQAADTGLYICKTIFANGCASRISYKIVNGNCKATLGNRVWLDNGIGSGVSNNGIQDGTEPGVANAGVALFSNGVDGLAGTADDITIGSAITDSLGNYSFTELTPGNYHIQVTAPLNHNFTLQTNTSDDNHKTGISTTGSDVNGTGISYTVVLEAGENNDNIDAGLISTIVLPIKIISFTVAPKANQVQLQWVVAEQINVASYEAETSIDGRTFAKITSIIATGNSSEGYGVIHQNPAPNLNYYRIKSIDKDGSISYSEIRKVNFGKVGDVIIYPNPVSKGVVNITITGTMINKSATVSILSMEGKLISQQLITKTSQTEMIDVSTLANGSYVVKIVTDSEVVNKTIQVIR
jgi:SdrD B-like domain/Secretion system C-terminal sorting domain/SprB repeat